MPRLTLPVLRRLSGILGLLAFSLHLGAEETLSLTTAQMKALRIVKQVLADSRDAAGSTLPAKVVVPTKQMRVLAAPVGGTLEMLGAGPGDTVRKGQALARIASPDALVLQREALQAGSQLALTQDSLRRDEALFKEGLIAESRLQATRAAASQAAAQAGERRQGLAMAGIAPGKIGGPLTLIAPMDGVVLEQGVQLGQRVEAAALIYRIAQLSPLWLEAQLPLDRLGDVRIGQPLRLVGHAFEGKVIALGRAVDPASQSVVLRASVEHPAQKLVPGQVLEVVLAGAASTGLRIPTSAVVRHQGQVLAFVQLEENDQGGRFAARPLRILEEGSDSLRVEGLKAGQQVVTSGTSNLKAMLAGIGKQ